MSQKDKTLVLFGNTVRSYREARALTQEKLAEKAGLDQTYISGIERGLRNPSIKNVGRLAKALGITVSELCEGIVV